MEIRNPNMFGQVFRMTRQRRGHTQAEAAELLSSLGSSISQPSVCRWETGDNEPEPDKFFAIAVYFQVSIEEVEALVLRGLLPSAFEPSPGRENRMVGVVDPSLVPPTNSGVPEWIIDKLASLERAVAITHGPPPDEARELLQLAEQLVVKLRRWYPDAA